MRRDDVMRRLCKITSEVMADKLNCTVPADCFCSDSMTRDFEFSERVLDFIEDACRKAPKVQA